MSDSTVERRTFCKGAAVAISAGVVGATLASGTSALADEAAPSSDVEQVGDFSARAVSPTCVLPDPLPNGCSRSGADPIDYVDAPETFDEEFDVIVVGAGGAGMVAAATVAEAGHSVLLLEKNGYTGGDTQFTLAITSRGTDWQHEIGEQLMAASGGTLTQNPWDYYGAEDLMHIGPVTTLENGTELFLDNSETLNACTPNPQFGRDVHISAKICDTNPETMQWLTDHGCRPSLGKVGNLLNGCGFCPCDPSVQGQEDDWLSYHPYAGTGYFKDCLDPYCDELGVDKRLECPVTHLVWDGEAVRGVVYEDAEGAEHVVGSACVLLATGGFAANQDMIDKYVEPRRAAAVRTWSQPGATGDGIRMAQALGAATRGMHEIELWDGGVCREQGATGGYTAANQLARQKSMSVNKVCKRYMDESHYDGYFYSYQASQNIQQPDMTVYTLFDSTMVSHDAIIEKFAPQFCEYPINDFDEQLAGYVEDGTVKKADTIAELAEMLGLDPQALQEAVDRYNGFCADGYDADYFKPAKYLHAITEPPFYGVEQYGGTCFATWGGLVVDDTLRVLDEDWQPIANLYAAGEQTFAGSSGGMVMPAGRLVGKVINEVLAG